MSMGNPTPPRGPENRVDDILDLIDAGLQTPMPDPSFGEVSPVNVEACWRCKRADPAEDSTSGLCEQCRTVLLDEEYARPYPAAPTPPPWVPSGPSMWFDEVTFHHQPIGYPQAAAEALMERLTRQVAADGEHLRRSMLLFGEALVPAFEQFGAALRHMDSVLAAPPVTGAMQGFAVAQRTTDLPAPDGLLFTEPGSTARLLHEPLIPIDRPSLIASVSLPNAYVFHLRVERLCASRLPDPRRPPPRPPLSS